MNVIKSISKIIMVIVLAIAFMFMLYACYRTFFYGYGDVLSRKVAIDGIVIAAIDGIIYVVYCLIWDRCSQGNPTS